MKLRRYGIVKLRLKSFHIYSTTAWQVSCSNCIIYCFIRVDSADTQAWQHWSVLSPSSTNISKNLKMRRACFHVSCSSQCTFSLFWKWKLYMTYPTGHGSDSCSPIVWKLVWKKIMLDIFLEDCLSSQRELLYTIKRP